jgi:hypothetical protein
MAEWLDAILDQKGDENYGQGVAVNESERKSSQGSLEGKNMLA